MTTKLQFTSSAEKVVQAAAILLRFEESHEMARVRLLKLLYIADRESINRTGEPILGSTLVAMKWGPLHSQVLDLIKGMGSPEDEILWNAHFSNENYKVKLDRDPGNDELSPFEIELLDEISKKYAFMDDWELVEVTHEFPEYKENFIEDSSSRIPYEDIFKAVGREEWIEGVSNDQKARKVFDKFFDNEST